VATDGSGEPVRISLPLEDDDSVWEYKLTPDGEYVIYGLDTSGDRDGSERLYAVPVGGGPVTLLVDMSAVRTRTGRGRLPGMWGGSI